MFLGHLVKNLAAFTAIVTLGCSALAQPASDPAATWPDKPVRIIVNFAPGGGTDNAMRPFLEPLQRALGQPFVIENRGGATGAIGVEAGVKSAPNGYTFVVTPAVSVAIVPNVRKPPYDPFKDLVPVSYFSWYPMMLAVHPSLPVTTLQELIVYGKANPTKLSLASSGIASTGHLLVEALNVAAGSSILHVPYRGSADALNDFLAGVVQIYADPVTAPHVKAGKARLLAVTGPRHPDFPDVPSFRESYPDVDFIGWNGVFAPAGTPEPIVRKMNQAMNDIAGRPEIAAILQKAGFFTHTGSPEDLAAILRRDFDRYGKLTRDLKIRAD